MYTVIEIENRNLASTHDVDSMDKAICLANRLMDEYLEAQGLNITDVDPGDVARAKKEHPRAFVDVYGSEWDAHIIRQS